MIVVLEGIDKTGKTTLAKALEAKGFTYMRCSQPTGDPYLEYMGILKACEAKTLVVLDRFCYGELVYGPLYRGVSKLSPTQLRNLELKLLALDGRLVYCHDTKEAIAGRFVTDGETFAKAELLPQMLERYAAVVKASILPVTKHQLGVCDLTKPALLAGLVSFNGLTRPYLPDMVGNQQHPRLILVGERRNAKLVPEYQDYRQPFDFGLSSQWLFAELERAAWPLSRTLILNSDNPKLAELQRFEYAAVVALGKVAAQRLYAAGIKHVAVGHPAYERRFHPKQHRLAKRFTRLRELYQ